MEFSSDWQLQGWWQFPVPRDWKVWWPLLVDWPVHLWFLSWWEDLGIGLDDDGRWKSWKRWKWDQINFFKGNGKNTMYDWQTSGFRNPFSTEALVFPPALHHMLVQMPSESGSPVKLTSHKPIPCHHWGWFQSHPFMVTHHVRRWFMVGFTL
jgi:hypothetical protein